MPGFDIAENCLKMEVRINVLEKSLEYIFKNNDSLKGPSPSELSKFKEDAILELQKRWTNIPVQQLLSR